MPGVTLICSNLKAKAKQQKTHQISRGFELCLSCQKISEFSFSTFPDVEAMVMDFSTHLQDVRFCPKIGSDL